MAPAGRQYLFIIIAIRILCRPTLSELPLGRRGAEFMWFHHLSLKSKFLLIVAAAFAGMALLAGVAVSSLRSQLLAGRSNQIERMVESGYGLVARYEAEARAGRMGEAEAKQAALADLRAMRFGDNDYFWVNDMAPAMVMHPIRPDLDGKPVGEMTTPGGARLFTDMVAIVKDSGAGFYRYHWPKPGFQQPVAKLSYVKGFAPWGWIIGTGIYLDDLEAGIWRAVVEFGLLGLAITVMVTGISLLISHMIGKPIEQIIDTMGHLADNDLTVEVPYRHYRDEIGAIAKALGVFKDNAAAVQRMTVERAELQRAGEEEKIRALRSLSADIGQVVGVALTASGAAVNTIRTEATSLAHNVAAATDRTGEAATLSEDVHGAVVVVGSAADRLVSRIGEINAQIAQSSRIAEQAVDEARHANATVQSLSRASDEISDALGLIADIAAQTNLLALNATIEAARAGEAGKGFAVVAGEVKGLASQTARATTEISDQVADIKTATDDAVQAIAGIGVTIDKVNTALATIARAVADQLEATGEISRGVSDATSGAATVSRDIAEIHHGIIEVGEATTSVDHAAEGLMDTFERLKSGVDELVSGFRAEIGDTATEAAEEDAELF